MRLSQDVIYYHLSREFDVLFPVRPETGLTVGRPIFFESQRDLPGSAVVIGAGDISAMQGDKAAGTLFICNGTPDVMPEMTGSAVIIVQPSVSPMRLFNELQKIYNLFDSWDEALNVVYRKGRRFSDLVDSCESVLSDPMSIMDKDFHYVAYSKHSEDLGLVSEFVDKEYSVPLDIVNAIINDSVFTSTYHIREAFYLPYYMGDVIIRNIFFDNEYIGRIMLRTNDNSECAVRYHKAVIEHLSIYIEALYGKYMSFSQKEMTLGSIRELVLDVLSKKESAADRWDKGVNDMGWCGTDELQLVQFRPNPRYEKNMYARYLALEIESRWQGCFCVEYSDRFLLVVNLKKFHADDYESFNQALPYFLRENLLVAGLSRPFSDVRFLCSAFDQTDYALELGVRKTPTLWYSRFDDHALSYILGRGCDGTDTPMVCSKKLLALKRHDGEAQTEYYETLRHYFLCKFNAVAAAKKMFIHRSTFIKRMERIQELVHIDYESEDEVLYLLISFRIMSGEQ